MDSRCPTPLIKDGAMQTIREMAVEAMAGLTDEESLAMAEELEELVDIIRRQTCAACEVCKSPPCWRRGLWRN